LASAVPARLTRREGRRFAYTVGIAFFALSALLVWRDAGIAVAMTAVPGSALLVAGLAVPTRLGPVQRGWMGLAHALSKVTTPIVLSVMYFAVLTPAGVLARAFGHRPLARGGRSAWVERPATARRSSLERQF
jgi:hypothetical protein